MFWDLVATFACPKDHPEYSQMPLAHWEGIIIIIIIILFEWDHLENNRPSSSSSIELKMSMIEMRLMMLRTGSIVSILLYLHL